MRALADEPTFVAMSTPEPDLGGQGETEKPTNRGGLMSEPRAIPDEERPFIPEEKLPAKESTDFDAEPVSVEDRAPATGDEASTEADSDRGGERHV